MSEGPPFCRNDEPSDQSPWRLADLQAQYDERIAHRSRITAEERGKHEDAIAI